MTKNKIARNVLSALMALCLLFTGVFAVLAAEVGDFTGDGKVSSADAVYLLRHTLFPDKFELNQDGDYTGDGKVSSADAVYLLRHTLFPDKLPLTPGGEEQYFEYRKVSTEHGFGYYISAKEGATLPADLVIPSEHDGLPVFGIQIDGFKNHGEIVSVTIPSSVYFIDRQCFAGCTGLKSVIIAEGKYDLSITSSAFKGDVSLETIELPCSLCRIYPDVFKGCTALKVIRYKGVEALWDLVDKFSGWDDGAGDYELVFDPVTADESLFEFVQNEDGTYSIDCVAEGAVLPRLLILPAKHNGKPVTGVTDGGIYEHDEIKYLVVPEPYRYLGETVFYRNENLFYVSLPASLRKIDDCAFGECRNIEIFDYDGTFEQWDAVEIHTDWHYTSRTNKEYVIKYRPTEDKYFSYRFLHSDDTGDYYAIGAKNVDDLPASIALPSEYDGYPVTCVNENGFRFAKGLKKIVIPEGYTDIGENAFEGCDALEYVDLPDSLYSIGASSFYSCESLKEIELPKNLYSLGRYSFSYSGLTHIEIPDRVELIGTSAFMFCYSLTDAFIGGRVRVLHDNAFEECTSLTTVTVMNKDITYIGTRAFALCSSLIAVNYNGTRDDWAKIDVQKSWTYNAGEYVMLYSGDCEAYLDLYVYSSGYYVITVNDKSALPEKLIIPTILYGCRVTGIDYNGFEDCAGIKELFIPYGIEFIGKEAFKGCTGLTSVSIPASVEWIYEEAFADCTNLKALVTSPCKELYIDDRAFKNCDLRYVTLSTGLRQIFEEAFANNANLTDLVIPDGVTYLDGGIIKNCTSLYMLTIPKTVSYLREGFIDGNPSLSFISFTGTVAEWEELGKAENWCYETKTIPVGCTDGYASSNGKPLG